MNNLELKEEDIHDFTLMNGIVRININFHWITLNDESRKQVNDLIIKLVNNPKNHYKPKKE